MTNILLGFMRFILIFIKVMKKIQVHKNGCKYILFRIDLYFNKFLLAVEVDEKVHSVRDSVFEEKRQEALEKRLGSKFIRINISNTKTGYDLDYEIGNVQAFIDEFKDRQLEKEKLEKKIKQKNKRTRRQNKRKRRRIKQKNKRTRSQNKRTRRQK